MASTTRDRYSWGLLVVGGLLAGVLRGETIPDVFNGRVVETVREKGNLHYVVHPVKGAEGTGRPLYVVLHSAGHDATAALLCTRDRHNHDIYRTPDEFYGLYLDCRENQQRDWWWGAEKKAGFEETACEKRVLATIEKVIVSYGIDRARVYLCGNSMGGSGTLGIGMRHGDVFAAVKANVPAIRLHDHPFKSLGAAPYALPTGARIPDPPYVVDYSAQNDDWSNGHERLVALMRERRYGWAFYWGAFGHADNDPDMLARNDIIHSLDWLSIRRDEPYPAFTDASTDDACPWPRDRASEKPGQINGFFRWSEARATEDGVQMTLRIASDAELASTMFTAPGRAVVDVTVRRTGRFQVKPDQRLAWTFGTVSGSVDVGADGLVTIPRLVLTQRPVKLVVARPPR